MENYDMDPLLPFQILEISKLNCKAARQLNGMLKTIMNSIHAQDSLDLVIILRNEILKLIKMQIKSVEHLDFSPYRFSFLLTVAQELVYMKLIIYKNYPNLIFFPS